MKRIQKLMAMDETILAVRTAQAKGESVVLCHGCFDIVHPGHVRHLQHASSLGDRLLVTVTGDAMMDKGAHRPLIPQELRAENLAALDCVDWVAVNHRPTAAELLEEIRPDIYVKGREYEHNRDPRFRLEREIVERHGGRVMFSSGDVVFSSTALIQALEDGADASHAALKRLIDQHGVSSDRIDLVLAAFNGKRVLVIGETIKDTYTMCDRPAVAGECPIMTLRPIEHRSFDGGAAIIARHLAAMGARPILLTALPATPETEALRLRLQIEGVTMLSLCHDGQAIEKQRFLVGSSKVMKLDLGGPITLDAAAQKRLVGMAVEAAQDCHAAIVADFGQGLLTQSMLDQICTFVRPHVSIMAGDVSGRRSNLLSLRELDLLCPSESEVRDALHDYEEGLNSVVWRLLHQTRSQAAIVTLGPDGLIAFDRVPDSDREPDNWHSRLTAQHVPALTPYAVDALGCGDALLAAATLSLVSGASLGLAVILGSVAAAAQARRLGNAVISSADLRRGIGQMCETRLAFAPHTPTALTA